MRDLPIAGACGIPSDALSVAANVTIVNPSAAGFVAFSDISSFSTSTLNFRPAQVRANSALLSLSLTGHTAVQLATPAGSQANLLLDVTGYFR